MYAVSKTQDERKRFCTLVHEKTQDTIQFTSYKSYGALVVEDKRLFVPVNIRVDNNTKNVQIRPLKEKISVLDLEQELLRLLPLEEAKMYLLHLVF